ncbi:lipopolysaccharide core biosynthesis protein WaaY [Escherichia coli]|nr:lipopolysaccharide core biosynthesis protein WaaY [Escherichia coli]
MTERFLKSCIKKDYYENLIYQTDRVRGEGIQSINDYFLLAERKTLNFAHYYIMLIEYIEGVGLNEYLEISIIRIDKRVASAWNGVWRSS